MQITDDQLNDAALVAIGQEAVHLACSGQLAALIARFGYALAFGRDPEMALREDFASCLEQQQPKFLVPGDGCMPTVSFFAPNDAGVMAVVECMVPTENAGGVLVELVVTSDGADRYVTLEQISACGRHPE